MATIRLGRKGVASLMRQAELSGLVMKKRSRTVLRVRGLRVADDLLPRDFTASEPNAKWVGDITYLKSWQGWAYLAGLQDLRSRQIIGWSMADHMRTELLANVLEIAVSQRSPDRGLIQSSDQGSQYASLDFGQKVGDYGIAKSMGKVGTAYDNSVAETFLATLKKVLIYWRRWPESRELKTAVFTTSKRSTTTGGGTPRSARSRRPSLEGGMPPPK